MTGRARGPADVLGASFLEVFGDLPEGERRFPYDEVERARTVFEWGSQSPARVPPEPDSSGRPQAARGSAARAAAQRKKPAGEEEGGDAMSKAEL